MKEIVINIIDGKISGAKDNLYRMNMSIGNHAPESEYGQSGLKCGDLLKSCEDEVKKLEDAKAWVLSV